MSHENLFGDAEALSFDVKPTFGQFVVDDDGDSLRALLRQDEHGGVTDTAMPMQSSAEGLFANNSRHLDLDGLLASPPPPLMPVNQNHHTIHISPSSTTMISSPSQLNSSPPFVSYSNASASVANNNNNNNNYAHNVNIALNLNNAHQLPVAHARNSHAPAASFTSSSSSGSPSPLTPSAQISIDASPPRFSIGAHDPAPVLDALEHDLERLSGAILHLCTAYVDAMPHERPACLEHARSVAADTRTALARAFSLRRRVVLSDFLPRWQRLADALHVALMRIQLLSEVVVSPDGTATHGTAIGALIIEEQSALPCAAMSKRQRPEGSITVRWVCSPIAIVACGGNVLRPRSVRVTIDVSDDVARDSFIHNVLAGEAKQFFKDSDLPLGTDDSVTFPLSFVNGTTGHVVCAQFECDISLDGQDHLVRSARSRPFALATHTRQWSGSSTALLLSCLLQQDEFVGNDMGDDDGIKDIRLDVPLTPEVGAEADDELSGEGSHSTPPAPATRRKPRARDDGPVRRTIVGNRKRASSDAGKRPTEVNVGGVGTAAAAALLAHAAGTIDRQRQPISPAYFGNVLAEHFERHARIDEHDNMLKASPLSTVRVGLATSDVNYLLERLRVFAAALDRSARLLERSLARFSEWFGAVLTMVRFQRPVAPLLAKGVVFGFMSRATAERAVQGQQRGTCVLRFAERHSSHFAIAYIGGGSSGDDGGRVRHYLLTDADMVKGVADFVLRKPHFSHVLRFAGVDGSNGAVRLQVLEKRAAMQFVSEATAEEQPARPIHEGYESLD